MIHIVVRDTVDWRDSKLVYSQLPPGFAPKVDAWNATFDMPFHEFRYRIKRIAELNLSRVEGATFSALVEVPEGDMVVPVDDDDWFAPEVVRVLERARDPNVRRYLWTSGLIEIPTPVRYALRRAAARLGRVERVVCKTNNYAFLNAPEFVAVARGHAVASIDFFAHLADVKRVPGTLSMQNRHLGSQTTLAWERPTISRKELITLFDRHRVLYRSWTPPRELVWAKPYVEMVSALLENVPVR